jgi:hypothetical protein
MLAYWPRAGGAAGRRTLCLAADSRSLIGQPVNVIRVAFVTCKVAIAHLYSPPAGCRSILPNRLLGRDDKGHMMETTRLGRQVL